MQFPGPPDLQEIQLVDQSVLVLVVAIGEFSPGWSMSRIRSEELLGHLAGSNGIRAP